MLPSTGSRGAMVLPMIGLGMMLGGAIVVLSGKKLHLRMYSGAKILIYPIHYPLEQIFIIYFSCGKVKNYRG